MLTSIPSNKESADNQMTRIGEELDRFHSLEWLGFEQYEVNPMTSEVRDKTTNSILPTFNNSSGYLTVSLSKNNKSYYYAVHSLVWKTVNGPEIPEGYEIDHINSDVSDNSISNLQLLSKAENLGKRTYNHRTAPPEIDCIGSEFLPVIVSAQPCGSILYNPTSDILIQHILLTDTWYHITLNRGRYRLYDQKATKRNNKYVSITRQEVLRQVSGQK